MPLTSGARATYDISTGTKQYLKGVRNHGQRYRYPRYFDQSGYMKEYDHLWAHGFNALQYINKGKHRDEVQENVFDVSRYTKKEFTGYFEDRILIITNLHILFV